MKDLLKRQYKNAFIVLIYMIFALLVYVVLFESLWHLWYIDVITGVVIVIASLVIGYFWLKAEDKKQTEENAEQKIEKTEKEELKSVENNQ